MVNTFLLTENCLQFTMIQALVFYKSADNSNK